MYQKEINIERPSSRNLECASVMGRDWVEYKTVLGIKPDALRDKRVLNFGSGSSNIGRELKSRKNGGRVVDFDLIHDPWEHTDPWETIENAYRFSTIPLIQLYLEYFNPQGKERQGLVNLKRQVAGTEGRDFVQGNGVKLPFKDDAFDYVIAFWSTYQPPLEDRGAIYEEFMRVGKIIHISPIFKNDYKLLSKLAEEKDYEIVASLPLDEVGFSFSSDEDYGSYVRKVAPWHRIGVPYRYEPIIKTQQIMGRDGNIREASSVSGDGGNTIVLRRNNL